MPGNSIIISPSIPDPNEDYLVDFENHYSLILNLCDFIEILTIKKNDSKYQNLKDFIPNDKFPSDAEIKKIEESIPILHSINIARGIKPSGSLFDFPSAQLYKVTVQPVTNRTVAQVQTQQVSIKPKDIPKNHSITYGSFLVYNENPNFEGRTIIRDIDNNIKTEVDSNGNTVKMVRWFTHPSPEGGLDTIGFGHKLTETENSTGIIVINGKNCNFRTDGLKTEEIRDLFVNDIAKKTKLVQSTIGVERWNWLIDNHPSWACILIDVAYTPGNPRTFPKLMYYMGLYDDPKPPEEGGDTAKWNQWVNDFKNGASLSKKNFTPFIRSSDLFLYDIEQLNSSSVEEYYYLKRLDNIALQTRRNLNGLQLTKRNASTTQVFVYHEGTHYDQILANGGVPLSD
jgi:hypothetical protein